MFIWFGIQREGGFRFRGRLLRAATRAANGFRLRPVRDAKRAATPATGGGHGHGQPRARRFPDVCVNCNGGGSETPQLAKRLHSSTCANFLGENPFHSMRSFLLSISTSTSTVSESSAFIHDAVA